MPTVLIVDDSPTAREILFAILSADPDLEVIGFANNGDEAVAKTKELHPDVITMDINMPRMGGLEATQEIMIESPTPIVIVSASTRVREVETTMKALRSGALTVLEKPQGPKVPGFAAMSKEIVETVKAMADVMVIRHRRRILPKPPVEQATPPPPRAPISASRVSQTNGIQAIGIVASTGGPPALAALLSRLPADFPVPILLVQHIVPSFLNGFAVWLNDSLELNVKIADDHERLESGCVYVGPAGQHLGVTRNLRINLSDADPIQGFRPAGTFLFSSMAASLGKHSIGVIMTGMGQDGVEGLKELHAAGGQTVAQDEESCVVFGMPRVAIEQGVVDTVLPVTAIGRRLIQLACVKA